MQPLVKGALAASAFALFGAIHAEPRPADGAPRVADPSGASGVLAMPCGARTLPDGVACVPVPGPDEGLGRDDDALMPSRGRHQGRGQGLVAYDHLPRRPDRPADAAAFLYPVGEPDEPPRVLSGYDLDRPASDQRPRVSDDHAVGHGAVDLAAPRGAPVHSVRLTGQEGPTSVVFVGELFGITVVTSHSVKEAGRLRSYLLFHGHLERPAPGLDVGSPVEDGAVLGFVGDTGSPGNVHLHLEVRRVRAEVELAPLREDQDRGFASRLVDQATSIPCDPRNVLPLR